MGRAGSSESRSGSRHFLMTSALLEPVPITTTHLWEESWGGGGGGGGGVRDVWKEGFSGQGRF